MQDDSTLPDCEGVYLVHLMRPVSGKLHYTGYSRWIRERIAQHRESRWIEYAHPVIEHGRIIRGEVDGEGAHLLARANSEGVEWIVVKTWPHTGPDFERKLKRQRNARRNCIVCARQEHSARLEK
jgi:hypothetical protein